MSETVTMTITGFLLARYDELEAVAERGSRHNARGIFANDNYGCLLVDPAYVLADIEAKRRIVEEARNYSPELSEGNNGEWAFDAVLRALALPFADHRDYREEWAP